MLMSSEWRSSHVRSRSSEETNSGLDHTTSIGDTWEGGEGCPETECIVFVSVSEVYEMAAAIGKDFETLIDRHGSGILCGLMPKVVRVLEELEEQAARHESQLAEVAALQADVERLEADKVARNQQRLKDEQDTLRFEENWKAETAELKNIIRNFTEENAQLEKMIEAARRCRNKCSYLPPLGNQDELSLLRRLRNIVDAQETELRSQKRILSQRTVDFDAVKAQAERLAHMKARNTRMSVTSLEVPSNANELIGGVAAYLSDELKDLQTRLKAKKALLEEIRHNIGPSQSTGCQEVNPLMTTSIRKVLNAETSSTEEESRQSDFVKLMNADDKMVLKTEDGGDSLISSSPPRFSCDELRQILVECMQLESKIIYFQDRLDVYKRAGDEDPPVQGPINREPADKIEPWLRPSISVKLLFDRLVDRIRKGSEKL